ncbi:unnamed protein product [Lymnaea stagnalis]|uniref:Beta-1,4-galactosyltransferase n=1 Tax=Lymnaea stagnalis TaxID=6523 RepID=A0AAV2HWR1_LYMST
MNRLARWFAKSSLRYMILTVVVISVSAYVVIFAIHIQACCTCSKINLLTDPSIVIDYDEESARVNLSSPSHLAGIPLNGSRQDRNHVILSSEGGDEKGLEQKAVASDESNEKVLPRCPRRPPDLIGPVAVEPKRVTLGQLVKMFPHVEDGGRVRPPDCAARQRLAVIVPFRNRQRHLRVLLQHLIPFLIRQQVDATFFIIEQAPGSTFNRGALLNVGFLEALKLGDFDCFVFHDVDLLPLNDRNLYRCGDNPRHMAVAINKYAFDLLYPSYFGGVVMFTKQQYMEINGNSNLYVGWGGEDDDLIRRVMNKGYHISRYANGISNYDMFEHDRDKGNEENPLRVTALKTALARQGVEGLNTLVYEVHSVRLRHLYTHVTVQINNTQLLQAAPSYVRLDSQQLVTIKLADTK